jgi:hypothetical protein
MRALSVALLSIPLVFSNAWSGHTFSRREWGICITLLTQDNTNLIESSKDSSSTSNDDILASFGRDLSSMKFDSSNNASGSLFDVDSSKYPQQSVDKATNDLTNAIEQNRKRKSVDPRTHG